MLRSPPLRGRGRHDKAILARKESQPEVGLEPLEKEKKKMKRIAMLFAIAVMFVGASYSAQKSATFSGDIMDSACAKGRG